MSSNIEFKLFAPRNQAVELLASFNNWQPISLRKQKNGYFQTFVDLEDGVYEYKFKVRSQSWHLPSQSWIEINDPYVTEINTQSQNGVIRIKAGKRIVDEYIWQYCDRPLSDNAKLVIYEMHVSDFLGKEEKTRSENSSDIYEQVISKLDYLSDLGINAIELMPVSEYPGDYSWGYLISYFFASECSYGQPSSLKKLIDQCHARGIRVIIDGIYNHSDEASPLVQIDRDYWYYHGPRKPEDPANYWGPEFNYEFYDAELEIYPARQFIGDVVRFWIQEYHIDGIRFDAVAQIDNDEFLNCLIKEANQAADERNFYNIAECIPETPDILVPKGPLEGCWHESFRMFVVEHITGKKFELDQLKQVLEPQQQGYFGATSVVNYLASHDRNHLLVELGDANIFDDAAFRQAYLGAILLMTAVGVPMISMGEEFGVCSRQTPNMPNQLDWSLLDNDRNRKLFNLYRSLIALRHQNSALHSDRIKFCQADSEKKLLAFLRTSEDDQDRVLVVVNFSDQPLQNYLLTELPNSTNWQDWLSLEEFTVKDSNLSINLEAATAKVLIVNR